MRLSTSTNILSFDLKTPYVVPTEYSISACAAAGYRYLDANLCGMSRVGKKYAPMTLDNWEQSVRAWRRIADDTGVAFAQAHAYFSVDGPVVRGGVPGGLLGEEWMRRSVLAAEILGVEYMVVHPFSVVENGTVLREASYEANMEYFTRWHKVYSDHGVGMAIENMIAKEGRPHPSPFATADEMIRLVDDLNQADVGVCLDTGHAYLSGQDPAEYVRRLGSRLRATHIADNCGQNDDHVAPFQGDICWPEVMRALREIDYQHDFAFEIQNLTSRFPLRLQGDLVRFSYSLGEYLLSLA